MRSITFTDHRLEALEIEPEAPRLVVHLARLGPGGGVLDRFSLQFYTEAGLPFYGTEQPGEVDLMPQDAIAALVDLRAALRSDLRWLVDDEAAPRSPLWCQARHDEGAGVVIVSWADRSDNEAGFYVQRRNGSGGNWELIATTGADVTQIEDAGLGPGAYEYRVAGFNDGGISKPSNVAGVVIGYGGVG